MNLLEWSRLLSGAEELRARAIRDSTSKLYHHGIRQFRTFASTRGVLHPLPAAPTLISAYIYYLHNDLAYRPSTIATRTAALQYWHRRQSYQLELAGRPPLPSPRDAAPVVRLMAAIRRSSGRPSKGRRPLLKSEFLAIYARGFDVSRPAGLHRQLALMLLNLGCLRRHAAARIIVRYSVSATGAVTFLPASDVCVFFDDESRQYYISLRVTCDKNVLPSDEVFAYIPAVVSSLLIRPVALLHDYLRRVRPPSGGFLLAAPRGASFPPTSFWPNPYGGFNDAFKSAYCRAIPDPAARSVPVTQVGSHSGRKSLAQWLWDAHSNLRLIADVGHWRCRGDAMNVYYVSSRATILRCIANL